MEETISRASTGDARAVAELAARMWAHPAQELEREFAALLAREDAAVFLARSGEQPVGFAQCQLRRDYVEGAESSPVGYLEGIFVLEGFRGRGCARALLRRCEDWARAQGCAEFASDCELQNRESLRFHLSTGFEEKNRIICFLKRL